MYTKNLNRLLVISAVCLTSITAAPVNEDEVHLARLQPRRPLVPRQIATATDTDLLATGTGTGDGGMPTATGMGRMDFYDGGGLLSVCQSGGGGGLSATDTGFDTATDIETDLNTATATDAGLDTATDTDTATATATGGLQRRDPWGGMPWHGHMRKGAPKDFASICSMVLKFQNGGGANTATDGFDTATATDGFDTATATDGLDTATATDTSLPTATS